MPNNIDTDHSKRLKALMGRAGFYWEWARVTDHRARDARVYRALSSYIIKALGEKVQRTNFRALLVDMYHIAKGFIARAAIDPASTNLQVINSGTKTFLEALRKELPWGASIRQSDFDALFNGPLQARDNWYLYICGERVSEKDMAARGSMAIAIDDFLDECDKQDNEWSKNFQRLGLLTSSAFAEDITQRLNNMDIDNDKYIDELFKDEETDETRQETNMETPEVDENAMELD